MTIVVSKGVIGNATCENEREKNTYLPVSGLTLKHHRILRLADLASILLLDILSPLLCLDTVILGEGTLVAGTTGVSQEVRSNGLNSTLGAGGDLTDRLEILISSPSLREDGERTRNQSGSRHFVDW